MDIDRLVLGIGKAGEPYEGIGRGELNIEGMPVYRDAVGGVGTPTSDNERTKISEGTTHLLAIMNGYSGSEGLEENVIKLHQFLYPNKDYTPTATVTDISNTLNDMTKVYPNTTESGTSQNE